MQGKNMNKNNSMLWLLTMMVVIVVGVFPVITLAVIPDYVVTQITITPASPVANSTFTANVTVANQGTAAGKGKQVTVWANQPNSQSCGAYGDQTFPVGVLAPGETFTVTV